MPYASLDTKDINRNTRVLFHTVTKPNAVKTTFQELMKTPVLFTGHSITMLTLKLWTTYDEQTKIKNCNDPMTTLQQTVTNKPIMTFGVQHHLALLTVRRQGSVVVESFLHAVSSSDSRLWLLYSIDIHQYAKQLS